LTNHNLYVAHLLGLYILLLQVEQVETKIWNRIKYITKKIFSKKILQISTSKFENSSLSINSETPNSLIVVSAKEIPTIFWSLCVPNLTDNTIGEVEISTLENKWSSKAWIFPGEAYKIYFH
jgi:hypothetical protein